MITWILRVSLVLAAPIAALFVSRDALNFGIVETLVAVTLDRRLCRPGRGLDATPAWRGLIQSIG
jgi:hypothetical protein